VPGTEPLKQPKAGEDLPDVVLEEGWDISFCDVLRNIAQGSIGGDVSDVAGEPP